MRYGTINCACKKQFYFESASEKVICIQCSKEYDVKEYPIKEKVSEEGN